MQQLQQSGVSAGALHPKVITPKSLWVYHSRRGLWKLTGLQGVASVPFYVKLACILQSDSRKIIVIKNDGDIFTVGASPQRSAAGRHP